MASAVHIPISELPAETKTLIDRVLMGEEIVVDADGAAVRLSRSFGRTAPEILADPTIKWSNAVPDENWARDLEEIIASRKLPERDPWAE
jgi:hypothetical protein